MCNGSAPARESLVVGLSPGILHHPGLLCTRTGVLLNPRLCGKRQWSASWHANSTDFTEPAHVRASPIGTKEVKGSQRLPSTDSAALPPGSKKGSHADSTAAATMEGEGLLGDIPYVPWLPACASGGRHAAAPGRRAGWRARPPSPPPCASLPPPPQAPSPERIRHLTRSTRSSWHTPLHLVAEFNDNHLVTSLQATVVSQQEECMGQSAAAKQGSMEADFG